ncbi:hypothetical protein [Natribacillus halophilus]|nr:hypothetical protein [Natribacillus halophilus]
MAYVTSSDGLMADAQEAGGGLLGSLIGSGLVAGAIVGLSAFLGLGLGTGTLLAAGGLGLSVGMGYTFGNDSTTPTPMMAGGIAGLGALAVATFSAMGGGALLRNGFQNMSHTMSRFNNNNSIGGALNRLGNTGNGGFSSRIGAGIGSLGGILGARKSFSKNTGNQVKQEDNGFLGWLDDLSFSGESDVMDRSYTGYQYHDEENQISKKACFLLIKGCYFKAVALLISFITRLRYCFAYCLWLQKFIFTVGAI